MKLFLTLFLSLFLHSIIYSQKNVVKIVPTNLLGKTLTLQYERVLTDKKSLLISLSYMSKENFYNAFSYQLQGFGIETAMKYAIGKKNMPEGWYFSPMIGSGRLYASSSQIKEMGTFLNVGNTVGHQWVLGGKNSKFTIDINGGFGIVYFKNDEKDYIYCSGLARRLAISIGYGF